MTRFARVFALLALAGCYGPDFGSPSFTCGPGEACPAGQECRDDGLCHDVDDPEVDAARTDAPDDPDAPRADGSPDAVDDVDAPSDAPPTVDGVPADAGGGPINDTCAGAVALTPGTPLTGQTTVAALDDASATCGSGADVAYAFTVPAGGDARAQIRVTDAVGFDPALHVQGACASSTIRCAQHGGGAVELLDVPRLSPGTYHVWVEAQGGTGTFSIGVDLLPPIAPPANDECAGAALLTDGIAQAGSTTGAADDLAPSCVPFDGNDTVHRIALGAAQALLVTVTPTTAWDLAASMRAEAECAAGADLWCVDGAFSGARTINVPNAAIGSYDVIVDGAGGAIGDYTIRYETRPADATFGYWRQNASGVPFVTIADDPEATQVAITTSAAYVPFSAADEGYYPITLPFLMSFYGTSYAELYAHTNGFVSFGAVPPLTAQSYTNDCPLDATAPLDLVAVFWDDAYAVPTSQLWHKVEGTAPHRRFILEYRGYDLLYCTGGGTCTLLGVSATQQIVLYEDGDVELRYGPRTAPVTSRGCGTQHLGCTATIGIRGMAGADFDQDQCDTATVTEGKVVTFIAPR